MLTGCLEAWRTIKVNCEGTTFMLRRRYPPITNHRAFSPERTPSPPPDLRGVKRRREYGPDNDPVEEGSERRERRPVRPS